MEELIKRILDNPPDFLKKELAQSEQALFDPAEKDILASLFQRSFHYFKATGGKMFIVVDDTVKIENTLADLKPFIHHLIKTIKNHETK